MELFDIFLTYCGSAQLLQLFRGMLQPCSLNSLLQQHEGEEVMTEFLEN